MTRYVIEGALTAELAVKDSPVRRFFDDRFSPGLREVQAGYRSKAGPLLIPGVPAAEANPGTIGTAVDWLMRFLVHPTPSLDLAADGARGCGLLSALKGIAKLLGYRDGGTEFFAGPVPGSAADPDLLYRACWALALLTEVYRRGPQIAMLGPLAHLPDSSARSLLAAAPAVVLQQLNAFRSEFSATLLPALAGRRGQWAPGPTLAGSALMPGDCDLIAADLLVELKAGAKPPSFGVQEAWQILGYCLMDYTDEFGIRDVALYWARYGYLAQWDLAALLAQLAGHPVSVTEVRAEFRSLLETCQ